MHTGQSYKVSEFLFWTRRKIYILLVFGIFPVLLYQVVGWKWLDIPLPVVAFLGTATAFTVAFKNSQTYNRSSDAQNTWTAIVNLSRGWGMLSRDFLNDPGETKGLIYWHLAWLTALRYRLREERVWEAAGKKHNVEYRKLYSIPEKESDVEVDLARYLSQEEFTSIRGKTNWSTQILGLQSKAVKDLFDKQRMSVLQFVEMERTLKDCYVQQGKSEQIKDSPYARQYAIINTFFVRLFCFLLPFGLLKEFDKLNDMIDGPMKGHMVWLVIPFSIIISWTYAALEQVGESTENPFEGGANDVPISQMCRNVEIDLLELIDDQDIPAPLLPRNNIIL